MTACWLAVWLLVGAFQRDLPAVVFTGPEGLNPWAVALMMVIVIDAVFRD